MICIACMLLSSLGIFHWTRDKRQKTKNKYYSDFGKLSIDRGNVCQVNVPEVSTFANMLLEKA